MVDEPIQKRIAKRGLADQLVPVLHRDLTGHQRGPPLGAVLDDFQQIAALPVPDWGLAPLGDRERCDLLEIMEDRTGRRATLVTSQVPVSLPSSAPAPGGHPKSPTCGHPKLLHLEVIV